MYNSRFFTGAPRIAAAALVSFALIACSDDDPVSPPQEEGPITCTMDAPAGDAFVRLCDLGRPVRHVRIENMRTPAMHASAQVVLGSSTEPTTTMGTIPDGQFRILFYGGGNPAPPASIQASFGSTDIGYEQDASFLNSGVTVCFDIHDGATAKPPRFLLWVSGQKGANCNVASTLTENTAWAVQLSWEGKVGTITDLSKGFFRYSSSGGTTPKVTLSSEPIVQLDAVRE